MSIEEGRRPDDLLATGKAAGLLGCSRQHVVDMCLRGELPYVWSAGTGGSGVPTWREPSATAEIGSHGS